MRRAGRRILLGGISLAALINACDDGMGPRNPGIHVTSATLTDTIYAVHPLQLVVFDTGTVPGRTEVRFQTPDVFDSSNPFADQFQVRVAKQSDSVFRVTAVDTTDVYGRLTMKTQLGYTAGLGDLVISVPTLGFVDTVRFTIQPGKPVGVTVAPSDTAIYTGREFQLRAHAVDRVNNPRADVPIEFSVVTGPVSMDRVGQVTTTAIGRAAIVARAVGHTDTAYVSIVPEAWVATERFDAGNGGPAGIFLMQLDGSGRDSLTSGLINSFTPHGFGWSPDGKQLVLPRGMTLDLLEPGGAERPLIQMTADLNTAARFSRDGQWVYFALAYSSPTQPLGLYRIHIDGSGLEHLGVTAPFGGDYFASPAHDGASVAYTSSRTPCFVDPCIRVLDLATNQDRVYGTQDYLVRGSMAAWSPVDDLIAFNVGGDVNLIRSDGTGLRSLATGTGEVKWMEWSPDGQWLVVADDFGVELLGLQTGLRLPIAQLLSHSATIWRP